jgi:hypothetical protein
LIRWDAFLVLNLGLDVVDGVAALHLQSDGLAGEGFHEDLHVFSLENSKKEEFVRVQLCEKKSPGTEFYRSEGSPGGYGKGEAVMERANGVGPRVVKPN